MSEEKQESQGSRSNRRRFLKATAGAATVGVIGWAGYRQLKRSEEELANEKIIAKLQKENQELEAQLGESAAEEAKLPSPKQQQVNKVYAQLYDKLSRAKTAAASAKKPLVIVVGEEHSDNDSALINLMVIDIAAKLGIGHCVDEAIRNIVDNRPGQATPATQNTTYRRMEDEELVELAFRGVEYHLAGGDQNRFIRTSQYKPGSSLPQHTKIPMQLASYYMQLHRGDPNRFDQNGKLNSDKVREPDMIKAIQGCEGDRLCIYGRGHLASICNGLPVDDMYIVPIDSSSDLTEIAFPSRHPFDADQLTNQAMRERLLSPVIQGKEVTPKELLKLFLVASETHTLRQEKADEDVIRTYGAHLQSKVDRIWELALPMYKEGVSPNSQTR